MFDAEDRAEAQRNTAEREMPKYVCHKQVWALKIAKLELDIALAAAEDRETTGGAWITPTDEGYAKFHVDALYVAKHNPREGGYYVVYADGYASFSPAAAFEDGYTKVGSDLGEAVRSARGGDAPTPKQGFA